MKYGMLLTAMICAAALSLPAQAAPGKTLRDAHAGLTCDECHVGQKKPVQAGAMSCAACHDPAEVAKSTADRGRKNPHISPHWGTEVPCWVCHKEHAKDENYCLICHTW